MVRIFIAGAGGQLGQDIARLVEPDHETVAKDHQTLDVADYNAVSAVIKSFQPHLVVNAAAFTNVDGCEAEAEKAFKVNAIGAQNLAAAAQEVGAAIVYPSTDYVFDGTKDEPYTEFDQTNPQGVYGRSKLAGEQVVTALNPRHYIIRTSWLYGPGKNFVKTILEAAQTRKELRVVDDQTGSPTATADLAGKIIEVAMNRPFGTYHVTNQGSTTWFGFTKEILEAAGINNVAVHPISTAESNRPAPRPKYSVLRNLALELSGVPLLRHYREALKAYVSLVTQKS